MTGPVRTRPGAVPAALATCAAGVGAHAAAAGCLPSVRSLLLLAPSLLLAALVVGHLLPDRPLLRLASGQLAVHGVLALAACSGTHLHATGAAPSTGEAPHTAMVVAHVLALVACRAGLDRLLAGAVEALSGLLRRCADPLAPVVLPSGARLRVLAADGHAVGAVALLLAPRRGPPGPVGLLPT